MSEVKTQRIQTTKDMFNKIHLLSECGLPAKEIAEKLNIGMNRISVVLRFSTYDAFRKGRSAVYDSWGNNKSKKKKIDPAPLLDEDVDRGQYKELQILGLMREQNKLMRELNERMADLNTQVLWIRKQLE